ncbi:MAG: ABC transporter permease subunit [Oceanococcus sp.]
MSQAQSTPSRTVHAGARLMKWRYTKDRLASIGVTVGGLGVIFAVVLIFFYLLWVVLPIFQSPSMEAKYSFAIPNDSGDRSLLYLLEEQGELALRVSQDGRLRFFSAADGSLHKLVDLGSPIAAATHVSKADNSLALLDQDGNVRILRHKYRLDYPEGEQRTITPTVEFPYGDEGIALARGELLSAREDDDKMTLAVVSGMQIHLRRLEKASSFFDESISLEATDQRSLTLPQQIDSVLMDPLQEWLYAANFESGTLYFYDLRRFPEITLVQTIQAAPAGESISAMQMLAGGISILTASSDGRITQWFPLRGDGIEYTLQRVRDFAAPGDAPVIALVAEQRRRGFVALSADANIGAYYATSERELAQLQLDAPGLQMGAVSPRANIVLLEDGNRRIQHISMHNEHPEVSWNALWGKIWYESYPEPDYIWQSSAANSDFEPKFSLSPLAFGTIKAAFYAMLFAVPLALAGAIYTAYFMSSGLRQLVKPAIEVMEALPTVILGFLAGLWLAPFVETHLPGVFLMIVFLPISMLLTGWAWLHAPQYLRDRVSEGWQPLLLVLPVILAVALALALSPMIETVFFGGSLPHWLDNEMGITYDQRNSLVVGLAMGFAVIPTIFSIAEDAVFSVPKQLTQGSLALGATPWQTLVRVVLPTASPGMFSALMIGLGRAVGETMIVLMATGNTPIMDFNIFEGFRTLSANIAVEMPESEVGSTHYRILFLAGLVLFMFTFVFNTLAEVIRQRLRMKYSNL